MLSVSCPGWRTLKYLNGSCLPHLSRCPRRGVTGPTNWECWGVAFLGGRACPPKSPEQPTQHPTLSHPHPRRPLPRHVPTVPPSSPPCDTSAVARAAARHNSRRRHRRKNDDVAGVAVAHNADRRPAWPAAPSRCSFSDHHQQLAVRSSSLPTFFRATAGSRIQWQTVCQAQGGRAHRWCWCRRRVEVGGGGWWCVVVLFSCPVCSSATGVFFLRCRQVVDLLRTPSVTSAAAPV